MTSDDERNYSLENYNNLRNHCDMDICTVLINYFNKYLVDGLNKGVDRKDLTIEKVIGNIFDRNFTNSFVLETVLNKAGLSISDFSNFEDKMRSFQKEYELTERQIVLNKFFDNTPKATIEFVYFVSKIHKIIQNNKENMYIHNDIDISVLSFFIGSYFVPNDFISYFKDNGISKEKVLNRLNLNLTKEKIEKVELDINIIIKNYANIIFGYTSNKEKVDINAVLFSLGNSKSIKSESILKLVKDINPNLRISDDFTNFIKDYNQKKDEIRRYTLEQKFFGDMQKESIKFIKWVSQTYQALEDSSETTLFSSDDLIEIAIYFTAIEFFDDRKDTIFLDSLKQKSIGTSFALNRNGISSKYNFNIDIIYNLFGKYIFGGKNKNKNKCDITIKDIYTNIFNKDVNNSIVLYKFLDDIGFDHKKFMNFDESFIDYTNQIIINKVKKKIENSAAKYFENVTRIYKNLLNMAKDGKLVYDANENIEEIKNVARLLSMLINKGISVQSRLSLLSKRGVNLDNYLQYLNISIDDFNKYQNEEIDYLLIDKEFPEYEYKSTIRYVIIDVIAWLFEQHDNGYLYENFIKFLNQSPEIIEKEMRSGEEVIIPLSRDEQIEYFMAIPIDTIDYSPNSISTFGIGLADHSLMIANEFVDIAINDDNERILNIQEEINKLKRKPSIFSKKKPTSEKIANKKAILDNLNDTLKENEARMIEVIDHFGYLKKLIASYVYRLDKYISVIEKAITNLENGVIDKQNGLENIDNKTILQALHDKLKDYQDSLVISVAQYQKINLLLNTYFINLNKTSNARNTVIPNLYIEISIRDSIVLEQESIAELNSINDLLDSIVKTNNQMLDKSTFQIKSKDQEVPKELIDSIRRELSSQNLISCNEDNKQNDTSNQIVKK